MDNRQVFALLGCDCISDHDERAYMQVLVAFDNHDVLDAERDNFFDETYSTIAKGLPRGWQPDDAPELIKIVPHDVATHEPHVVHSTG